MTTTPTRFITHDDIVSLNVSPRVCLTWVEENLLSKYDSGVKLPPKVSLTFPEHNTNNGPMKGVFHNIMPCVLNAEDSGIKVVTRYPTREPSILGHIMLYDVTQGILRAVLDATWITCMRTGAVAAHAIHTFAVKNYSIVSFIGLGNTARATMLCLMEVLRYRRFMMMNDSSRNDLSLFSYLTEDHTVKPTDGDAHWNPIRVRLFQYRGQEKDFERQFEPFVREGLIEFQICSTHEECFSGSDVIVSCVTTANELLGQESYYKPGVLVIPVHTRGFQNCDLVFDKVFGDDTDHIRPFKYFNDFSHKFHEVSQVLLGQCHGRESDEERIIVYNIGIALHDIKFSREIYNLAVAGDKGISIEGIQNPTSEKHWLK